MNTKKYYISILAFIASLFLIAASGNEENKTTNKDIIKFSHSLHSEMAECADCHTPATEAETLSDRLLPNKSNCADCHDVEDDDNCSMCHYEDVNEPLIQTTSDLIFNHKFHINEQNKECIECHKGMTSAEVDYGFQSAKPDMAGCMDCHNENAVATTACEACHTSTNNLVPKSHNVVDFFKKHKFVAGQSQDCAMCHDSDFCEACHAATTGLTETNSFNDFYTPYSPHKLIDNEKTQQISLVHDLNYRYSHGIDAKLKSDNCVTCHETETFCAECHSSMGGDYAMGGFIPQNHSAPNFTILGLGTGGGLHADLARRDIENCAACHDVEGADPNCVTCHIDPDGIKGTNAKTHVSGFMMDDDGDWHTDFNSTCYVCHTDANANPNGIPNVGFCGYCHK